MWRLKRFQTHAQNHNARGVKKVSFDTGDVLLAVDALYVPRDKDFCVQRTYQFCVESECFSILPRFSNLRSVTNAFVGTGVSPQDVERAFSKGLAIE